MTRYVLADLDAAAQELARRAAELNRWLDDPVVEPAEPLPRTPLDDAVAYVEAACRSEVASVAVRLEAAATSLAGCASDVRAVDVETARRVCAW